MTDPITPRDVSSLTFENARLHGELERAKKGRISGPVALMFFCVIAGGILAFSFLVPPLPDLRAEYCRGIGDGEARSYNSMREFIVGIETKAAGMGLDAVSVAINQDGEIVESVLLSETVFPARPENSNLQIETACNVLTIEEMVNQFHVRGPSDEIAPAPSAPVMGGGPPPQDK